MRQLTVSLFALGICVGGATDAEVEKTLPGDEFVAQPKVNATHAITINAPVEKVWPWLVQIGQRRAGFYIMERRMMPGIKGRAEANLKPTNEGTLNAHHG